jgi:short-subunit dehydrogenase
MCGASSGCGRGVNLMAERPVAAITGASSGIGEVFARKLAARGHDLLLIARRKERLDRLGAELSQAHGIDAESFAADLASDTDVCRVAERLRAEPRLTVLVNNAGFGVKGRFFNSPVEEQERMHRVHVMATVRLTHAALEPMVENDNGAIVNVASVAAFARSQGNVSYCATKAWMTVFTEGLYLDLRGAGSKVRVQALCPGYTHTEFHDVMRVSKNNVGSSLWLNAGDVVEESLRGLERGKLFVVPGFPYKFVTALVPKLPTGLRVWIEQRSPQSKGRV